MDPIKLAEASCAAPDSVLTEIARLQEQIVCSARTSLEKAIRIGELLSGIRAATPHGSWGELCRTSLPFTERTARNYMRLFDQRERLKSETVSDLSDAYRLLSGCDQTSVEDAESCVGDIKRSIQRLLESIAQLLEIRESRLYAPEFASFEDFLEIGCNTPPALFERRLQWCINFREAQEGRGSLPDLIERLADGELPGNEVQTTAPPGE
jgi:hypothetical protein